MYFFSSEKCHKSTVFSGVGLYILLTITFGFYHCLYFQAFLSWISSPFQLLELWLGTWLTALLW